MAKLYPPSQKTACVSLRMNVSKFCFGGILHPTKQGRRNPNREVGELHPRGRNDGHKLDYSKITENIVEEMQFEELRAFEKKQSLSSN